MPELGLSEAQLNEKIKSAILELLQERRELFHELIIEGIEDMAMVQAIDEGKDSEPVSREDILAILEPTE